ncbi:hypothetical protein ACFLU5_09880 [Bacteroidota bacterium]
MINTWISTVVLLIFFVVPNIGLCQISFSLPDDNDKRFLQELYRDQKIKEITIYKQIVKPFDTTIYMIFHQFFDENGNMLEEKNMETDRTTLNFFDQNGDIFRKILFIKGKKINSTYYYFNRYDRIIATEIYDRLDSLSVRNYYNHIESENEIKCIISNCHGDTTQIEYLFYEEPETMRYERLKYPDILACEIYYAFNSEDRISRKVKHDILQGNFESWGFAYDEKGRRFIGERYNENQEQTGTVEYFHDTNGLLKREIYRDRGGRIQHEIIYEYQKY